MFDIPMVYPLDSAEALTFVPRQGYGCIYYYDVAGRKYVGQTRRPLNKRHKEHIAAYDKGCVVDRIISKNEHQIRIVAMGKSTHMNTLEREWVAKLDTVYPRGWNLSTGGDLTELTPEQRKRCADGNRGKKRTSEQRERMRNAHLGKKLTPEHRAKIRESTLKRNYHCSEELKQKLSRERMGHKPYGKTIPVVKCDCAGNIIAYYPTIKTATQRTGIDSTTIYHSLKGIQHGFKGFYWNYA